MHAAIGTRPPIAPIAAPVTLVPSRVWHIATALAIRTSPTLPLPRRSSTSPTLPQRSSKSLARRLPRDDHSAQRRKASGARLRRHQPNLRHRLLEELSSTGSGVSLRLKERATGLPLLGKPRREVAPLTLLLRMLRRRGLHGRGLRRSLHVHRGHLCVHRPMLLRDRRRRPRPSNRPSQGAKGEGGVPRGRRGRHGRRVRPCRGALLLRLRIRHTQLGVRGSGRRLRTALATTVTTTTTASTTTRGMRATLGGLAGHVSSAHHLTAKAAPSCHRQLRVAAAPRLRLHVQHIS